MKLLVIVFCLLSERYLSHKIGLNRFGWFEKVCDKLISMLPKSAIVQNPWVLMMILILPWVLIVGVTLGLLKSVMFGIVGFLTQLIVFYYCLGPNNVFYPLSVSDKKHSASDTETSVSHYFSAVNNQLFGVVFWYVVLGPLAVLIYRLISLCQHQSLLSVKAKLVTSILDWVPARVTVLLYLLVGNFERGFHVFVKKFMASPAENNHLLSEVGLLAVRVKDDEKVSLPQAEGLVEHAMIAYLVLIALFTMVSWL
jgi:AmpE protein